MMSNSYINTADVVVVPINNNIQNNKQIKTNTNNQNFMKMQQFLSYQPYSFNSNTLSVQQNQCELNHLVSSLAGSGSVNDIKMELQDKPLWNQFHSLTNEMILTKAGRRTFPVMKLRFSGLEDTSLYTILIEFRISDNYKYRFVNGEWRTTPRNDSIKNTPPAVLYVHPDSPNFGHHWTKDNTAFSKLKLTNNENNKKNDSVFLKSLHKYDPVIHVYKHDKKNVDDKQLVFTKFFKETEFIAVTAYQNENVTSLKIKHNPFAKAFQNNQKECTIDSNALSQVTQSNIKQGVKRSNESALVVKSEYDETPTSKRQSSELQQPFVLPSIPNTNQNDVVHNQLLSVKNIYSNQDLIQNWYNNYYPLPNHHHQIASNNNFINQLPLPSKPALNGYSNQAYDSFNYQPNGYFYNQNIANDYNSLQQNNHFNNNFHGHQNQIYNNSQAVSYQQEPQQIFNQQHQSYDYGLLNDTNDLSERRKQSSPIYDLYSDAKSNIVKRSTMLKDNRMAPYNTTRPSAAVKRNQSTNISTNSDSLSVSPVYNANGSAHQHTNQESDDSLNLTENFVLSPIQNHANNSASFTSTASSA